SSPPSGTAPDSGSPSRGSSWRRLEPASRSRARPGAARGRCSRCPWTRDEMTPSVLIIEDEAALAGAIEGYLRRHGAAPRTFPAAEAALAALAEVAPDVALVDLHLPGMDGLAALQAIRSDRPETQVIV